MHRSKTCWRISHAFVLHSPVVPTSLVKLVWRVSKLLCGRFIPVRRRGGVVLQECIAGVVRRGCAARLCAFGHTRLWEDLKRYRDTIAAGWMLAAGMRNLAVVPKVACFMPHGGLLDVSVTILSYSGSCLPSV